MFDLNRCDSLHEVQNNDNSSHSGANLFGFKEGRDPSQQGSNVKYESVDEIVKRHSSQILSEEDVFSATGGLELDKASSTGRAIENMFRQPRSLLLKNFFPTSEEELTSFCRAFGQVNYCIIINKQQGWSFVSYFDTRAAESAQRQLQGFVCGGEALEATLYPGSESTFVEQGFLVLTNVTASIERLHWLFSRFGEISNISTLGRGRALVSFFDTRHAANALKTLQEAEQTRRVLPFSVAQQSYFLAAAGTSLPSSVASSFTSTKPSFTYGVNAQKACVPNAAGEVSESSSSSFSAAAASPWLATQGTGSDQKLNPSTISGYDSSSSSCATFVPTDSGSTKTYSTMSSGLFSGISAQFAAHLEGAISARTNGSPTLPKSALKTGSTASGSQHGQTLAASATSSVFSSPEKRGFPAAGRVADYVRSTTGGLSQPPVALSPVASADPSTTGSSLDSPVLGQRLRLEPQTVRLLSKGFPQVLTQGEVATAEALNETAAMPLNSVCQFSLRESQQGSSSALPFLQSQAEHAIAQSSMAFSDLQPAVDFPGGEPPGSPQELTEELQAQAQLSLPLQNVRQQKREEEEELPADFSPFLASLQVDNDYSAEFTGEYHESSLAPSRAQSEEAQLYAELAESASVPLSGFVKQQAELNRSSLPSLVRKDVSLLPLDFERTTFQHSVEQSPSITPVVSEKQAKSRRRAIDLASFLTGGSSKALPEPVIANIHPDAAVHGGNFGLHRFHQLLNCDGSAGSTQSGSSNGRSQAHSVEHHHTRLGTALLEKAAKALKLPFTRESSSHVSEGDESHDEVTVERSAPTFSAPTAFRSSRGVFELRADWDAGGSTSSQSLSKGLATTNANIFNRTICSDYDSTDSPSASVHGGPVFTFRRDTSASDGALTEYDTCVSDCELAMSASDFPQSAAHPQPLPLSPLQSAMARMNVESICAASCDRSASEMAFLTPTLSSEPLFAASPGAPATAPSWASESGSFPGAEARVDENNLFLSSRDSFQSAALIDASRKLAKDAAAGGADSFALEGPGEDGLGHDRVRHYLAASSPPPEDPVVLRVPAGGSPPTFSAYPAFTSPSGPPPSFPADLFGGGSHGSIFRVPSQGGGGMLTRNNNDSLLGGLSGSNGSGQLSTRGSRSSLHSPPSANPLTSASLLQSMNSLSSATGSPANPNLLPSASAAAGYSGMSPQLPPPPPNPLHGLSAANLMGSNAADCGVSGGALLNSVATGQPNSGLPDASPLAMDDVTQLHAQARWMVLQRQLHQKKQQQQQQQQRHQNALALLKMTGVAGNIATRSGGLSSSSNAAISGGNNAYLSPLAPQRAPTPVFQLQQWQEQQQQQQPLATPGGDAKGQLSRSHLRALQNALSGNASPLGSPPQHTEVESLAKNLLFLSNSFGSENGGASNPPVGSVVSGQGWPVDSAMASANLSFGGSHSNSGANDKGGMWFATRDSMASGSGRQDSDFSALGSSSSNIQSGAAAGAAVGSCAGSDNLSASTGSYLDSVNSTAALGNASSSDSRLLRGFSCHSMTSQRMEEGLSDKGAAASGSYLSFDGGGDVDKSTNGDGCSAGGAAGIDGSQSGSAGGRLSRRTNDPAAEMERKVQQERLYSLDLNKILSGEDKRTTLMVKNIPNKYTQKMLLAAIDESFSGMFDFFYLPIDFKNKCNVGYAFVNITDPLTVVAFVKKFDRRKWGRFNSDKICNITYARIQGRVALVAHFQHSSLMNEDKRCRPVLFSSPEEPSENARESSCSGGGGNTPPGDFSADGGATAPAFLRSGSVEDRAAHPLLLTSESSHLSETPSGALTSDWSLHSTHGPLLHGRGRGDRASSIDGSGGGGFVGLDSREFSIASGSRNSMNEGGAEFDTRNISPFALYGGNADAATKHVAAARLAGNAPLGTFMPAAGVDDSSHGNSLLQLARNVAGMKSAAASVKVPPSSSFLPPDRSNVIVGRDHHHVALMKSMSASLSTFVSPDVQRQLGHIHGLAAAGQRIPPLSSNPPALPSFRNNNNRALGASTPSSFPPPPAQPALNFQSYVHPQMQMPMPMPQQQTVMSSSQVHSLDMGSFPPPPPNRLVGREGADPSAVLNGFGAFQGGLGFPIPGDFVGGGMQSRSGGGVGSPFMANLLQTNPALSLALQQRQLQQLQQQQVQLQQLQNQLQQQQQQQRQQQQQFLFYHQQQQQQLQQQQLQQQQQQQQQQQEQLQLQQNLQSGYDGRNPAVR